MSDQVYQTPEQIAAGQPPIDPGQPVTLTRAELEQIKKEIADTAFQRAQSYIDKQTGPVREQIKKLEEVWDMQAKAGAPVDDATKAAVKARLVQEAMVAPYETPSTPAQANAQAMPQADPIYQTVMEMQQEAGIFLDDADPEVRNLDQSSPRRFLKSVEAAIETKRQRIANPQPQTAYPAEAAPRVPGVTGGAQVGDRQTQIINELNEAMKHPSANADRIKRLSLELQKIRR